MEATEETLEIVERTTSVTTTSRYAFDGASGNVSGSKTVATSVGSLTPRIAIRYGQDGEGPTTSTRLDHDRFWRGDGFTGRDSFGVTSDDCSSEWAPL